MTHPNRIEAYLLIRANGSIDSVASNADFAEEWSERTGGSYNNVTVCGDWATYRETNEEPESMDDSTVGITQKDAPMWPYGARRADEGVET